MTRQVLYLSALNIYAVLKKTMLTSFCICILCALKRGTVIVPPSAAITICPLSTMHWLMSMHCSYLCICLFKLNRITVEQYRWTRSNRLIITVVHVKEKNIWKTNIHYTCIISLLGNKLTLETRPSKDGIDIRQELLKFHSTYYSSNLMGLCVLGRGKSWPLTNVMCECCKYLMPCTVSYSRQQRGTNNASHVWLGGHALNHNI